VDGDSFSYDMFSQVAQALRAPMGPAPLGGLSLKRVIAIGESQSATRLVTYVDAIHPLARVYDGFLLHSRGGGAPLSQAPQPAINPPAPARIRDDVDVPVLTLQTETDLLLLGFLAARQPDHGNFRLWEVAGTAHGDTYQLLTGILDAGKAAADTTYLPPIARLFGGLIRCNAPINSGPRHYVLSAALFHVDRWIRTGRPPRRLAPRLEVVEGDPPAFALDEVGNVRGGIRTPAVDVPIATYSGLGQTGSNFCFLFGTTAHFDAPTLASLYPDHETYVDAVTGAARAAVRAGFVLRTDAREIRRAAAASSIGR
jgi:hypothetical protein